MHRFAIVLLVWSLASLSLTVAGCGDSGEGGQQRVTDHVKTTASDLQERVRDGDQSAVDAAHDLAEDFGLVGGKARAETLEALEILKAEANPSERLAIQEVIDSL